MNPSENIVRMRLADLTPAPWNPRKKLKPGDKVYEDVKRSIERHGNAKVYVIGKGTGFLISGHLTRQVEMDMGIEWGDVKIMDLALEEEKSLNIALNKIGSEPDMWDYALLKDCLEGLDVGDFGLVEVTGFDSAEMERLMTWNPAEGDFPVPTYAEPPKKEYKGKTDPDEVPEIKEEPVSKIGDLWILGSHRVLCGDSTKEEDVERLMEGKKGDSVLTDPPYQMGKDIEGDDLENDAFLNLHVKAFSNALVNKDSSMICFHGTRAFPVALESAKVSGWEFKRMLWLFKPNDCTFPWRGWILKSESILVFQKGKGNYNDTKPYHHDTYEFNHHGGELNEGEGHHPTVKPCEVVVDLIARISKAKQIIYDPFLGSGTTLIACEKTGRICYGIEIEPRYIDVIIRRWQNFTGKQAIREDGVKFSTLEAVRMAKEIDLQ